jgi:hypothetical protein
VLGTVYVSASTVSSNVTQGRFSGGIEVFTGGVSVMDSSQVNNNSSNGPGGGITDNFLGTVTVSGGSEVNANTGAAIGGGLVNFSGKFGSINVTGASQVNSNKLTNAETIGQVAATFVGLIQSPALQSFAVVVSGPGGTQMQAALKQAAKMAHHTASLLQQALRQNPTAARAVAGGGIGAVLGCAVAITSGSQVNGNTSGVPLNGKPAIGIGGGLFAFRSPLSINDALVNTNSATAGGGGIWSSGTFNITSSVVFQNKAAGATTSVQGGGLLNGSGGRATILNAVIAANNANLGGGLANQGSLTVIDTTIENNVATSNGGGIFNLRKLVQVNNTFSNNTPNDVGS